MSTVNTTNNNCYQLGVAGCSNAFGFYDDTTYLQCHHAAKEASTKNSGAHSARGVKPKITKPVNYPCQEKFANYQKWVDKYFHDRSLGYMPFTGLCTGYDRCDQSCCSSTPSLHLPLVPESRCFHVANTIRGIFECGGCGILCCCVDLAVTGCREYSHDLTGGLWTKPRKIKGILKNPQNVNLTISATPPVANSLIETTTVSKPSDASMVRTDQKD